MVWSLGFANSVPNGGALGLVHWSVTFTLDCLLAPISVFFLFVTCLFEFASFFLQVVMSLPKARTMGRHVAIRTLFITCFLHK